VDEQQARQLIADHFAVAGRDEVAAAEIFTDDAVIEWPQSGERILGKPNIVALHEAAPGGSTSMSGGLRVAAICG
jgi:ketosteroid isomerase-like protein